MAGLESHKMHANILHLNCRIGNLKYVYLKIFGQTL